MSVQTDNSFLKIQNAGELISVVVGYKVNNKLEIIWNTSIGADFDSNHYVLKKELAVLVDSLIRPFETKKLGFDGNYY